MTLWTTWRLQW